MQVPTVIDDGNWKLLVGDGDKVDASGETRLLSAIPKPAGHDTREYSLPFSSAFKTIPRSEWSARIKEQKEKRMRVSDFQKFDPHNQGSLPTCWANGPAHAFTTTRVIQGNPLVYISGCSLAVPISGGHSGGYEGDALNYLVKHGGVSVDIWPNTSTNRSLTTDPRCQENRKNHFALESFECDGFDEFATAALLGLCGAVAYNWWSHVISTADLVEIESGSFGFMQRNNWGDWGSKNDYGFSGYTTMREGRGTPSSGFMFRQVTSATI